jgi:membrane associated rhomboid family serine protease
LKKFSTRLKSSLKLPAVVLSIIWLAFLLNFPPTNWGVLPLSTEGLKGILFSPLIHGDLQHIISNSAPFFMLFSMMLFFYPKVAKTSFGLIYILSGLLVWVFGRESYHIGASGVVYGMVSFLFWSGIFRRSIPSIVISLIVTFLYSGLWLGVLPNQPGVSWEGHLMGGLVGVFVAYLFKNSKSDLQPSKKIYSWEDNPTPKKKFFGENPFETPRPERQRGGEGGWYSNNT